MSLLENDKIAAAVALRPSKGDPQRLFNGFVEGFPGITIDGFGDAIVVVDRTKEHDARASVLEALEARAPKVVVWKQRGESEIVVGKEADLPNTIEEASVRYAFRPLEFHDPSFYVDTALLRAWAMAELADKTVLNVFSHTGSLGVAARAGKARRVVHIDKSAGALDVAKASYGANGFDVARGDFRTNDFFLEVARLKREDRLYDCAIVDPPFFAATRGGRVDVQAEAVRLINKVRPLIAHEGTLVFVANALYLSGKDFLSAIEGVAASGYVKLDKTIGVPKEVVGLSRTIDAPWPADPAPFEHPTKIVVLRITRKDLRRA